MGIKDYSKLGFDTKVIHAGQKVDAEHGALSTPIYQTSTFVFDTVEACADRFSGKISGCVYSRSGNPTTKQLEAKIAAIEGGETCIFTSSGMGAIGATIVGLLKSGDHIICGDTVYGGTSVVMHQNMPNMGIDVTFVDTTDPKKVKNAIKPNTKMLYFESLANPTLKVTDIAVCAEIAHEHDILVVVDNTFLPPPILQPLALGADLVVHSVTKYINGHGDVLGGAVIGSAELINKTKSLGVTKLCGNPPSPFNSWLVIRGLKTLPLRVRQHSYNALKIAEFLQAYPYIEKVYYPGLESHKGYEIAKANYHGLYGGMISFELKDGIKGKSSYEAGVQLLNNLEIYSIGVSLGDIDSLIEHPASMTHASIAREERLKTGITDGLIRVSVGLENAGDLIADLRQAFDKIQ